MLTFCCWHDDLMPCFLPAYPCAADTQTSPLDTPAEGVVVLVALPTCDLFCYNLLEETQIELPQGLEIH